MAALREGSLSVSNLKLFLQFAGHRPIELIDLPSDALARAVAAAAEARGGPAAGQVFAVGNDAPLDLDTPLAAQGIKDKDRVHVHPCERIQITLTFADVTKHHPFRPSVTVAEVKAWFVDELGMTPVDATEHVLQVTAMQDRPDPDTQIGALVVSGCALELTLVPVKRVEG